ncbi:hypothetical protein EJ419_02070 [Alloscardovia theropitheci]|uniref:KOW domain-containing protein n=1 Tax=Alloscardovia theropitheci TaxID=2496842 RepID=A0A4R0QQP3_9BIFI|nr:DUF6725 family protein [Alloscardovia theropitheci]TCD54643.1 hypothetical protein EJ419_02070 [Alloscardovia theropitheci]
MDIAKKYANIPQGARVVIRTHDGIDEFSGRIQYRDYVGHVDHTTDNSIVLNRDGSANGHRPSEIVDIPFAKIVRLKPIPERPVLKKID